MEVSKIVLCFPRVFRVFLIGISGFLLGAGYWFCVFLVVTIFLRFTIAQEARGFLI